MPLGDASSGIRSPVPESSGAGSAVGEGRGESEPAPLSAEKPPWLITVAHATSPFTCTLTSWTRW
jgi:hypothetical protein